jgi:hypothetical protein
MYLNLQKSFASFLQKRRPCFLITSRSVDLAIWLLVDGKLETDEIGVCGRRARHATA